MYGSYPDLIGLCLSFSLPTLPEALPSHATRVHIWNLVSAWALAQSAHGPGDGGGAPGRGGAVG
jgi:hypothetical protein